MGKRIAGRGLGHQDDLDLDSIGGRVGYHRPEVAAMARRHLTGRHGHRPFQHRNTLGIAQDGVQSRDRTGPAVEIVDIPLDHQQRHAVVDIAMDVQLANCETIGVHLRTDRRIGRRGARPERDNVDAENPAAGEQQGARGNKPAPGPTCSGHRQGVPLLFLTFAEGLVRLLRRFDRRRIGLVGSRLISGRHGWNFGFRGPYMTAGRAAHTSPARTDRLGIGAISRRTGRAAEYYAHDESVAS